MRAYKLMADVARLPDRFHKYVDPDNPHWVLASEQDRKQFWERFEAARIFVFDQQGWEIPKEVPAIEEPDLDVPFQSCFFENLFSQDGNPFLIGIDGKAYFSGALLYEIAPTRYDVYFLSHLNKHADAKLGKVVMYNWEPGCGNLMAWAHQLWLDKLKRSDLGVESVREKIKIGSGTGQKHFHEIRKIIRVVPRHHRSEARPAFSREIDWSHRWAVRGHWRRHEGLGKNRAGEYCVEGFTWVTEHIRGPEDAPLIEKVRFVPAPVTPARVAEKESESDEP